MTVSDNVLSYMLHVLKKHITFKNSSNSQSCMHFIAEVTISVYFVRLHPILYAISHMLILVGAFHECVIDYNQPSYHRENIN